MKYFKLINYIFYFIKNENIINYIVKDFYWYQIITMEFIVSVNLDYIDLEFTIFSNLLMLKKENFVIEIHLLSMFISYFFVII